MNRRDFLKALGMGSAVLAVPKFAYAQNPLQYPLTSRADLGTELDERSAAKARKVAEYVITRNKQKGLLSYNPNLDPPQEDYQRVEAVMVIDGMRYTVFVINANERGKVVPHDNIHISFRQEGTKRQDQLTTFSDEGLDGICNYGHIPAEISGIGKKVYFNSGVYGLRPEGLEHKERFQKLYIDTLGKLVKFYEQK